MIRLEGRRVAGVRATRASAVVVLLGVAAVVLALGCGRRRETPKPDDTPAPLVVKDGAEGLLLTWIDEKGDFHVEQKVSDVPLIGRDAVRVVDPTREEGTHSDRVFVADMRVAKPDGTFAVQTMTRLEFDALAVARRQKSAPAPSAAPGGKVDPSAAPDPAADDGEPRPVARAAVIIYGASWCGACHDAAAYLRGKGIAFVEKDIEADGAAAREMRTKLARAGLRAGSIPVLDVRGHVMVGFNVREVDGALGQSL